MSTGAWLVRGFGPEQEAANSVCVRVLLKDERLWQVLSPALITMRAGQAF